MDGSGMDGPWKWSLTRPKPFTAGPNPQKLRGSEAQRLRPDNRGTRTLPGSEPDLIRVGQTKCSRPLPPHCREASPEMEHFLHHAGYGLIELHGGKKRNLGGDHQTLFPSCSDHLYPAFQNQRTCSKVLNKKSQKAAPTLSFRSPSRTEQQQKVASVLHRIHPPPGARPSPVVTTARLAKGRLGSFAGRNDLPQAYPNRSSAARLSTQYHYVSRRDASIRVSEYSVDTIRYHPIPSQASSESQVEAVIGSGVPMS
ncbi:hypothetical protein AXG93_146s1100 [Marchantia polymorpha subsp. ruderalis]|uniref:Uncharacterized protein n=1 Tax=Marchantia polymorpha subsp. ruderalis TaxID=1480154 RepID=A0A176WA96_MARPO|nr:hypothetical protein AXG93_146s1100 [Marchantia polymorpha subsp. ruderalis]